MWRRKGCRGIASQSKWSRYGWRKLKKERRKKGMSEE